VPKTNAARHPIILLIDGIGGWKERWWQWSSWNRGRVLIDSLVSGGYAVVMIDAFASGERTHENDYETAETFVNKFPQFRDLALQNTIEHRRLLDYLATRNDIDTTRVACLGLSLGGMTTFYLAANEPRIKAGVAGVTPMQRIPDVLWPGHYAPHVRVPMLMLMGSTDAFYTKEQVERVFNAVASSQKKLVWYETGHRLPAEYAGAAVAWFREHLR
jgi:dienelactone hydrolase